MKLIKNTKCYDSSEMGMTNEDMMEKDKELNIRFNQLLALAVEEYCLSHIKDMPKKEK